MHQLLFGFLFINTNKFRDSTNYSYLSSSVCLSSEWSLKIGVLRVTVFLWSHSLVSLLSSFLALIHYLSHFGVILLSFFALFVLLLLVLWGGFCLFVWGVCVCLCEVVIVLGCRHVRLWLSSSWLVFQLLYPSLPPTLIVSTLENQFI